MNNQSNLNLSNKLRAKKQDGGFSLIEVAIALTTMGVCLAYAMPLILYSKMNNNKSEMRAGALIVSQKMFDDVRGRTFGNIPTTDTTLNSTTQELGRSYNVSIRYCEPAPPVAPAVVGVNECTTNYRKFKITVRDPKGTQTSDNSIVYEMEAAFTDFK
jgi:prepilin-type N-terminal cleavage/methylation domain-containing protein